MKDIRSVMFICCLCAVISAIIRMISPQKMQKEMALICTLVMIICVMSVTLGTKFSAVENCLTDDGLRAEEYSSFVLIETRHNLESSIESLLNSKGIYPLQLVIQCSYDEYNYIRAEKVSVILEDSDDPNLVLRVLKRQYPNSEIEVMT